MARKESPRAAWAGAEAAPNRGGAESQPPPPGLPLPLAPACARRTTHHSVRCLQMSTGSVSFMIKSTFCVQRAQNEGGEGRPRSVRNAAADAATPAASTRRRSRARTRPRPPPPPHAPPPRACSSSPCTWTCTPRTGAGTAAGCRRERGGARAAKAARAAVGRSRRREAWRSAHLAGECARQSEKRVGRRHHASGAMHP